MENIPKKELFEIVLDVAGAYLVDNFTNINKMMVWNGKKSDKAAKLFPAKPNTKEANDLILFNTSYYAFSELILPMIAEQVIKQFKADEVDSQVFLVDFVYAIQTVPAYKYGMFFAIYIAMVKFVDKPISFGEYLKLIASEAMVNIIADLDFYKQITYQN